MNGAEVLRDARAAEARALYHKRAAARHRRAARDWRRRQADLEARCRSLGIDFSRRDTPESNTGEGDIHGRPTTSRPHDAR